MSDLDCLFSDAADATAEMMSDQIVIEKSDESRLTVAAVVGEIRQVYEDTGRGKQQIEKVTVEIRRPLFDAIGHDWKIIIGEAEYLIDEVDKSSAWWTIRLRRRVTKTQTRPGYRNHV